MEYRGRKREFEKIPFLMECPSVIALNGGKKKLGSKISCLGTFKKNFEEGEKIYFFFSFQ